MASLKSLSFVLSLCVVLPLCGQTNDWDSVEQLAPGTPISVVKRGRQNCELVKVTGLELECDRHIGEIDRRLVFTREQVREVRLEEPEHNQMKTGAIIGTTLGGLVGMLIALKASDPEARGYAFVYGSPIGGSLGAAIGHNVHRHGAIIYRRP